MPRNLLQRVASALLAFLCLAFLAASVRAAGPAPDEKSLLLDTPKHPVPAADFSLNVLGGKTYRLSDLRGNLVFVNFWATWCVPCLLEMPAMDRLNRKMKGKPFRMIAVNVGESEAQVRKFAGERNFSFDIVLDPRGEISEAFNANRLPMTYLVDREGNIIRRAVGAREWDRPVVVRVLEHLIGPGPPGTARN